MAVVDLVVKFSFDAEAQALATLICDRVERVGVAEVERRIGCPIDEMFVDMLESGPSSDDGTISLRPSPRLRAMAEAVTNAQPLQRAIERL